MFSLSIYNQLIRHKTIKLKKIMQMISEMVDSFCKTNLKWYTNKRELNKLVNHSKWNGKTNLLKEAKGCAK